jgi:hypothetical protein
MTEAWRTTWIFWPSRLNADTTQRKDNGPGWHIHLRGADCFQKLLGSETQGLFSVQVASFSGSSNVNALRRIAGHFRSNQVQGNGRDGHVREPRRFREFSCFAMLSLTEGFWRHPSGYVSPPNFRFDDTSMRRATAPRSRIT